MYFSLYDNQEVMERSYLLAGLFLGMTGFPFAGFILISIGFQVEDEERALEEQLLDAGEPTLNYAITLQRDIASQYYFARDRHAFFGFSRRENEDSDFVEEYVSSDFI
jgi:hypothetical protein